jgi:hypothetical protein
MEEWAAEYRGGQALWGGLTREGGDAFGGVIESAEYSITNGAAVVSGEVCPNSIHR